MGQQELTELERLGWGRYHRSHVVDGLTEEQIECSLRQLRAFYAGLPPDRYEPESHRYRRHARAVYLPWEDHFSWLPDLDEPQYGPVVDYDMQGYNSEFSGVQRRFPAIPPAIRSDPLIERIIRFDIQQAMWLSGFATSPLNVGVGCVSLTVPDQGGEAVSTPNVLHQDGGEQSFTFVHLMVRDNVIGGVNYIAGPRCVGLLPWELAADLIDAEFLLEEPLDAFAVHNSRVSHYVSPVRADRPGTGRRGVLLVAISPLVKKL